MWLSQNLLSNPVLAGFLQETNQPQLSHQRIQKYVLQILFRQSKYRFRGSAGAVDLALLLVGCIFGLVINLQILLTIIYRSNYDFLQKNLEQHLNSVADRFKADFQLQTNVTYFL